MSEDDYRAIRQEIFRLRPRYQAIAALHFFEDKGRYVFGTPKRGTNPGEAPVPYAGEGHFARHTRYNLTMRLTNKESSKGR